MNVLILMCSTDTTIEAWICHNRHKSWYIGHGTNESIGSDVDVACMEKLHYAVMLVCVQDYGWLWLIQYCCRSLLVLLLLMCSSSWWLRMSDREKPHCGGTTQHALTHVCTDPMQPASHRYSHTRATSSHRCSHHCTTSAAVCCPVVAKQ